MTSPPLVCLIAPGHVSSTPRLVKNADALVQAGYRVHVIAGAPSPLADHLDASILRGASWGYSSLNSRQGPGVVARKIVRLVSRRLVPLLGSSFPGLTARAHFAEAGALAEAAALIPARLFIGHSLAALPAAASAAGANDCGFGFDIEDFHDAETEEALSDPIEVSVRKAIQSRLLPLCQPLLCAAPLIARKYNEVYGVNPTVVLNAFPLAEAPASSMRREPVSASNPAIFYWFSQTIGPGRGLEKAIAIMAKMHTPVTLHLRGFINTGYAAQLQAHAKEAGLERPVVFMDPGDPADMARLAASADLGLSIEHSVPLNRDICLTNKIFIYLLAGIPQLMSTTSAQTSLSPSLGKASILCDLDRPGEAAAKLDVFFSDNLGVERARAAAVELSRTRFCWDIEKKTFLDAVRTVLPLPR